MLVTIKDKRYHRAIPEATSKADAKKAEAIFRAELLQGRYSLAENRGEMLFQELVKAYNEYAMANRAGWEREQCRVNSLLNFFQNKKLKEITPILIERYRLHRKGSLSPKKKPVKNSSINRETAILRKMLNIAVDNEWLDKNPCLSRQVKPLREDSRRERFLQSDEEERLISKCEDRLTYMKPILICALHTGMRKGEILNLTWDRVDIRRGFITVTKTKTGLDRNIPISPTLKRELQLLYLNRVSRYVFANPVTKQPYYDVKGSFDSLLKAAEIEGLVFHDLRHTAATRMVSAGIDLVVVKEILGHSCIDTTMRYSHPVPERKLEAVEALDSYRPREIPQGRPMLRLVKS